MENLKEIAREAVACIRSQGAAQGQIFVTESQQQEFNVENGELTLFRTTFNQDTNVLVYKDKKKGTYFTNRLTDVESSVKMAVKASEEGKEDDAYDIPPCQGELYGNKGVYEPDRDMLFQRTKEFMDTMKKEYPQVMLESLIVSHWRRHMAYANTNDTFCEEFIGRYGVSLGVVAHEGENVTSVVYTGFLTESLDTPFIDMGDVRDRLRIAVSQLGAEPMEGKFTGTVVFTPSCLGQFLYYTGGLVNGGTILEKTSIWLDKLDKQVADSRISIRIDPADGRVVCGETITFDGRKSEAYDWIHEGKLKSFPIDYYVAKKTGYEPAKNGQFNLVVAAGDKSVEEIIRGIDKGIVVADFSGGMPGANGEFSGVAKSSFLIEKGQVTKAVSEAMINGNLAEMMMHLVDISSETFCDGEDVLPYMAFDGIVISGK